MGVTKMPPTQRRLPVNEESSDDNQSEEWAESDWRASSSSEPRFSLLALPAKVRSSVFRRPQRKPKPKIKTKARSSTADTTRTSSASSTPRDSALCALTKPQASGDCEKFRVFWDEKLRSAMDRLRRDHRQQQEEEEDDDDAFHLLLKLYAHQDVVAQLYSSYDANAAELEFYIPQLCTFLLHGNYAKQHQLECFLMSRSGDSLPFAHRLTWFLRSFCDDAREYQSEYLSVTASQDQENSDLLTAIGRRAGVPALLMNSGLCVEEVSAAKPDNLQRRRSTVFPSDNELDSTTRETDESFAGHLLSKRNSIQDEARTDEGNFHQIELYRQTPKFVEALTDLAEQLIPTPRPTRNSELRKGLSDIQEQMLPSDVIYLPIGHSYHRVKGIQVDECFTFSTKERVPYFLCVEVLDYSVQSPKAGSKKQRKRRKSKAARNQSRVFSLKLPFANSDVELSIPMDDSPMSSSTSPESELSFVPSPSVASPLPEIEEENAPASAESSIALQEDGVVPTDALDGEDGDDEKEEGRRKPRKSVQEDEDLYRTEEEQQDRLGQWNLPRPRRRSIKDYSSSASARSGGQFDSFYSSWFSKKAQEEADEESNLVQDLPTSANAEDVDQIEDNGSAGKEITLDAAEDAGVAADSAADNADEAISADDDAEAADETVAALPTAEAVVVPNGNGGIFSSIFSRKPKPEVDAQQSQVPASSNPHEQQGGSGINDESAPAEADAQKPAQLETSASSSTPAPSGGLFSSLFSKKPVDASAPALKVENEPKPSEITESSSEECAETVECGAAKPAAVPAESVGIFGSLFSKKPQTNMEAIAAEADGSASVSSLDPSEDGASDDLEADEADGEESESKEALPSDTDPVGGATESVSSLEPSEGVLTDDADAEDADAEDTDSNDGLFSDNEDIVCEPERSPMEKPTEKSTSFVSWFSRKPVTGPAEPLPVEKEEFTLDATAVTDDKTVSPEDTHAEVPEPSVSVNEDKIVAQEEVLPQQRPRDLSVSLDFADPTAWKEKFDLEDGPTDDEPDAEAGDADALGVDAEEDAEASDDDEKPMIVFRERWSEKEARIRRESPFGDHPGWRLLSVIVKSNDDLRQEQFAAQLIAQCDRIFREYSLPLSLRPYNVMATSAKTGLIEAVPDTVSLDSLKRNDPGYTTLLDFYTRLHGEKETTSFARAQRNFIESLAAYSIVCYVFQIKDRHNGNILVDTDGHVIHIDFGFLLTNSPGSNWNFERAPFKLTDEFVELMGGPRSSSFRYFRTLCIRAYLALRRNMDQIVLLVEMMLVGNSDLPCFAGGKKAVIEGLRARLKPGARTSTCQVFVNQLIDQSINNWRTRWYDKYQRACLGIL
ncbi:hypothetical protein PF005_g11416 [Phytophthora fragariae]|uniref:1-phosphatidylinositol 4-kinase n=1 Tax=Phytophthora fragariae TaxID=53985 RepID=A0A6A3U089_9STRA|nr:hypothetical protein PF003_g27899 [Phytophthora fragariae]KAE8944154.1 hypothetical protein PF009_g6165 [Phytophthora fragariae]KAE9009539.1 hypothetical protein PF011_g10227 [Phytophthora fragariae]KAE9111275.1 hypothetical protein PF010_g10863 [Phytophthora fragariae]KAE9126880.1 hypothetical protein PF007_g5822 [Phytophthora fragariae]